MDHRSRRLPLSFPAACRIPAAAAALALLACRLSSPAPAQPTPLPPSPTPAASPTPFPTEAPPPAPSPTPPATAAAPKVLFTERFDDETTCFRMHSFEPGVELGIEDGAYHVRVEGDSGVDLPCMGGYDDFVLNFSIAFAEAGEFSLVGFTYRAYVGTSYNIYLTGFAEFCWDHADFNTEEFRTLAGCWAQLPEYVTSGVKLHVSLIAAQDRMAVLFDGNLLAAISDATNDYGSFGFFVLNNGPGATEIVLDDIVIRELVEEDLEFFREDVTGN